jgi:hypothetical protein
VDTQEQYRLIKRNSELRDEIEYAIAMLDGNDDDEMECPGGELHEKMTEHLAWFVECESIANAASCIERQGKADTTTVAEMMEQVRALLAKRASYGQQESGGK